MKKNLQAFLTNIDPKKSMDIMIVNADGVVDAACHDDAVGTQVDVDVITEKQSARIMYEGEEYFVIFGQSVDETFARLFLMFFEEEAFGNVCKTGVRVLLFEILNGSIDVSDAIRRSSGTNLDFLTKCIPLLISTKESNKLAEEALEEFIAEKESETCFSVTLNENEIVLVYVCGEDGLDMNEEAESVLQMIESECMIGCMIGIGRTCNNLFELRATYTELQSSLFADPVFDSGLQIVDMNRFSIGRLIRELDEETCRRFVDEVTRGFLEEYSDGDFLNTINVFFKCNLNSSEAAREMFIHRNTLVYRLNKIKKVTGYDISNFDDAFAFKWAVMLYKYLQTKEQNERNQKKGKKEKSKKKDGQSDSTEILGVGNYD